MSRGSEIGKTVREFMRELGEDFPISEWDDDVWDDIEETICDLYVDAWEGLAIIKGVFYEIKTIDALLAEIRKCE